MSKWIQCYGCGAESVPMVIIPIGFNDRRPICEECSPSQFGGYDRDRVKQHLDKLMQGDEDEKI
jgi:hypothetical protein